MTKPIRVQRQRTKGYKLPPNTVYVGRPTKWGNPYIAGRVYGPFQAVKLYREYLTTGNGQHLLTQLSELRGHNLACWCKPGSHCHADVLLELANQ